MKLNLNTVLLVAGIAASCYVAGQVAASQMPDTTETDAFLASGDRDIGPTARTRATAAACSTVEHWLGVLAQARRRR